MRTHTVVDSPVRPLVLVDEDGATVSLWMTDQKHANPEHGVRDDSVQPALREQLDAYFRRDLKEFDVRLAMKGTPFQQSVWAALRRIPYGTTWSYGQLAAELGNPTASRAVGLATGRNPCGGDGNPTARCAGGPTNVPNPCGIVVPCHRVVGSNGKLIGYGGGLERKRF